MIKHGFTIIELIIAMLIASIVSMMLLSALKQAGTFQASVDDFVHVAYRATIAQRQLNRDLAGAFIPVQAEKKEEKAENKEDAGADIEKTDKEKKTKKADAATKEQKEGKEKEKKKPLEGVFVGGQANKKFSFITCITSNPMEVYWSKSTGQPKPRIGRIYYYLEPEKDNKKSFTLWRQEGTDLELAPYQKKSPDAPRGYPLISGIKTMSVEYGIVIEHKKEDEKEKKAEAKKPEYEYKTFTEWTSDRKKEKDAKKQEQQDEEAKKKKEPELPLIPHWIKVMLELWDTKQKSSRIFTFVIPILIDSLEHKDEKKEPQKEKADKETDEEQKKKGEKEQKQKKSEEIVSVQKIEQTRIYVVGQ